MNLQKNLPDIVCPERLAKIIREQGPALITSDRFQTLVTTNIGKMPEEETRSRLFLLMRQTVGFNT
jgi:hypothetical protein